MVVHVTGLANTNLVGVTSIRTVGVRDMVVVKHGTMATAMVQGVTEMDMAAVTPDIQGEAWAMD